MKNLTEPWWSGMVSSCCSTGGNHRDTLGKNQVIKIKESNCNNNDKFYLHRVLCKLYCNNMFQSARIWISDLCFIITPCTTICWPYSYWRWYAIMICIYSMFYSNNFAGNAIWNLLSRLSNVRGWTRVTLKVISSSSISGTPVVLLLSKIRWWVRLRKGRYCNYDKEQWAFVT